MLVLHPTVTLMWVNVSQCNDLCLAGTFERANSFGIGSLLDIL